MVDNIKSEIQCLRDDVGVEFQRWYDETKQLARHIGTEEEIPRIPRIQCKLVECTPLLYYERSVGFHFIDILLQQLQNHFSADNCWSVSALLSLIPSLMVKLGIPPPEQWCSALTLMKIHYGKHIYSKQIADRFIKEHPRLLFKASLFDSVF